MGPNGQDFVIPNASSFFSTKAHPGGPIRYSQWQCATVDLSSLVGWQVTLEFINEDCDRSGHFGYTYLDNLCGGCRLPGIPQLTLELEVTSECGNAPWCFNYTAPTSINTTVELKLTSSTGQPLITKQSIPSNGGNGQVCFILTADEYQQLLQAGNDQVNLVARGIFSQNGINLPVQYAGKAGYDLKCTDYGIAPCCGPLSDVLLPELFQYEATGGLTAPFYLRYTPTLYFEQALKAFYGYQKAIHPNLNRIRVDFLLSSVAGNQNGPLTPVAGGIVTASQTNVTAPNFFTPQLTVNQWYQIEASVYGRGADLSLPERCGKSIMKFRIQVSTNARHAVPTMEFFIGGKMYRKSLI